MVRKGKPGGPAPKGGSASQYGIKGAPGCRAGVERMVMRSEAFRPAPRIGRDTRTSRFGPGWKLEDAKARFSEVVRRARTEGPQLVTTRGKQPVVVIAAEELERLLPPQAPCLPFLAFMESLYVAGSDLNLEREFDSGREIDL
jgi:antitoxin Phd